jgi:hypothetical protein
VRPTLSGLSAVALKGALSIGLLLALVQPSSAVTVYGSLNLSVDSDDNVTVLSLGVAQVFGVVGSAGEYGFINGWGVSSNSVTWFHSQANPAAVLSSSGMSIPVTNQLANVPPFGSVNVTGSPTLGAALRQTYGTGSHSYTSTFAQGSISYDIAGNVTIQDKATLIQGLSLQVDGNTHEVTIPFGGSPVAFGDAGEAGNFGLLNGWRVEDGDLTWRDGDMMSVASLDRGGLHVLIGDGLANSDIIGFATLSASSSLGFELATEFGPGTFAYSSFAAESATTGFYIDGSVTVPEPSFHVLAASGLLTILFLASVRETRKRRAE